MYKNFFIVLITLVSLLMISSCKEDSTPTTPGGIGTTTNHPPDTPSNPFPALGQNNVPYGLINLTWDCSDPDSGDALTYNVYKGSTSLPTVLVAQNIIDKMLQINTGPLEPVYWKVVARDNHGDSTAGSIWNFITGSTTNHPPDSARNPYPPNGATNIPHGDVTLSWTCTDPDQGDTLTYNIYVSTISPPLAQVAQNHPTTSFVINVPSGSRYWRIVSKDNHGDSTQGFIWNFRVQ
jgi:hypothetical protein